ncbi:MAG TPA: hypothetical protein VLW88_11420 [Hyphomicrobium sp.]|nr:hypothetical protein [Hyphomicrobium sp.]
MSVRILGLGLVLSAGAFSASPLAARECNFGELADKAGEAATMTAKIKEIEPQEDNPKQLFITVDNEGTDHCFSFITGLPKAALGNCAVGKTVTATGKIHQEMDAWWGLDSVKSVKCK